MPTSLRVAIRPAKSNRRRFCFSMESTITIVCTRICTASNVFPLQLAILLSRPGEDFTGGEFVMTEQRPRMQTRPMVVPLDQGDGVIFAVHHRPVQGKRGVYRVNMRHGVSRVRSGHRHTLGIIFHDAT